MSVPHETERWIERWWMLLVILFGITLVTIFLTYNPHTI